MADTLPTAPGPSPEEMALARLAVERGWVSLVDLEEAVARGSDLITQLKLTEAQVRELSAITVRAPALPPEVQRASGDPAARVGRYLRLDPLGAGGMGSVYRGWDLDLRRWVALKFLKQVGDESARAYFRREALLAASLDHPHIAKVYEVGEHEGVPFIAMQFVDGETLASRASRMRLPEKLAVVRRVSEAIAYAHERGIIHRDLKPSNILIDKSGHAFVTDFGLAKEASLDGQSLGGSNAVLGTPQYMAPEQARGKADSQSDVYGLGAVLYDLTTGLPPFTGETPAEVMMKLLTTDPIWPRKVVRDLPEDVEAVILKALERDKTQRYADARQLLDDLDAIEHGEPLRHARRPTLTYWLSKKVRRHRAISLLGAGLFFVLLAGAALGFGQLQKLREERRLREQDKARAERTRRALQKLSVLAGRISEEKRSMRARAPAPDSRAELERAVGDVGDLIRDHPDLPQPYFLRARGRLYLGEFDGADRDLARALSIARDFRPAWTLLGMVRLEQYLEYRITRRDGSATTHAPLAEQAFAYLESGWERGKEREESERWGLPWTTEDGIAIALIEAMRSRFRDRNDRRGVAILDDGWNRYRAEEFLYFRCIFTKDTGGNLEDLSRALERAPGYAAAYCFRGLLQFTEPGDHRRAALADLNCALQLRPHYPLAYACRGLVRSGLGDSEGALEDYTRAITLAPHFSAPYTSRGELYASQGKLAEAMADYNQVIRLDPANGFVRYLRGRLRENLADRSGALGDYDEGIRLDPRSVSLRTARGQLRIALGNLAGAKEDFTILTEERPREWNGWFLRGLVRYDLKEFPGVVRDFTVALSLGTSQGTDAFYWRGMARMELKDYGGARDDLGRALSIRSGWGDALHARGFADFKRGDWRNACEGFSEALNQSSPKQAETLSYRGYSRYAMADYSGARTDLSDALLLHRSSGEAYYWRASARNSLRDPLGALHDLTCAIPLPISDAIHALYFRGRVRYSFKDYLGAADDLSRALARAPNHEEALYWRGAAYLAASDPARAVSDFRRLLEKNLGHADAWYWRGRAHYTLKEYADSGSSFERAAILRKNDADAWYWCGSARYDGGDFEGALAPFTRVIGINPHHPEAHHWRGMARYAREKFPEAIADFTRAVDLRPYWFEPLLQRSLALRQTGDRNGALRDLGRAIGLRPQALDLYAYLGYLHFERRAWKEALADLRKALEGGLEESDYPRLIEWIARARSGERKEADEQLRSYLKGRPSRDGGDWPRALARYFLGELREGELDKEAASNEDRRCEANYYVGIGLLLGGDRSGARRRFESSVKSGLRRNHEYWFARSEIEAWDR